VFLIALVLGLGQQSHIKQRRESEMADIFVNPSLASPAKKKSACFDTGIPFIKDTIKVPYDLVPSVYLFSYYFVMFLFEQPLTLRFLIDFFWVWFYLRFFMV